MHTDLFYGEDGALAGFSNAAVLSVEVGGRTVRAFSAGVDVSLRYQGGPAAARFGFGGALREKLRHPRRPLAYLCMASNPAVDDLHPAVARRVWPRPAEDTPPDVAAAARAVSAARGLSPPPGDPPDVAWALRWGRRWSSACRSASPWPRLPSGTSAS